MKILAYHLQISSTIRNLNLLYELNRTKDMKQILVVLPLEYLSIFMLTYRDEHFVDGLSNNSKLGLEICFLHHMTSVCKLNHLARPCQRLWRSLKKSLLHRLKGCNQKICISCVYWKGVVRCKNQKYLIDIQ